MSEDANNDSADDDFRWPQAGDRIFSWTSFAHGAFVVREPRERGYHMRAGYKLAADLLVEQAEAEQSLRRKLVYPILHSYRHYLELTLKRMLQEFGTLGNEPANWSDHDLKILWASFRRMLATVEPGHDDPGTDAVGECIAEFAKIDPGSYTFRYPVHRNGKPFDECKAVDLRHLYEAMKAIENYFTGAEGYLENVKDTLADYYMSHGY
jgi:hypothetical protein